MRRLRGLFFMVFLCVALVGCGAGNRRILVGSQCYTVVAQYKGQASYYADKYHGKATASGELYDRKKFSAAHRNLKFGTMVRVTNMKNKRSVVVKVNDRGPFVRGRIIDLSYAAAVKLDMIKKGVADIILEVLEPDV
jgi:rare lipoprotein A